MPSKQWRKPEKVIYIRKPAFPHNAGASVLAGKEERVKKNPTNFFFGSSVPRSWLLHFHFQAWMGITIISIHFEMTATVCGSG